MKEEGVSFRACTLDLTWSNIWSFYITCWHACLGLIGLLWWFSGWDMVTSVLKFTCMCTSASGAMHTKGKALGSDMHYKCERVKHIFCSNVYRLHAFSVQQSPFFFFRLSNLLICKHDNYTSISHKVLTSWRLYPVPLHCTTGSWLQLTDRCFLHPNLPLFW